MPIVRRRQPGFGEESLESARARDLQERRERTKDINWSSQGEMDDIIDRKRKAEDEEPYNTDDVRTKQMRIVAQAVAKRSLLQGVGSEDIDIGYGLPSSRASAEEEEEDAEDDVEEGDEHIGEDAGAQLVNEAGGDVATSTSTMQGDEIIEPGGVKMIVQVMEQEPQVEGEDLVGDAAEMSADVEEQDDDLMVEDVKESEIVMEDTDTVEDVGEDGVRLEDAEDDHDGAEDVLADVERHVAMELSAAEEDVNAGLAALSGSAVPTVADETAVTANTDLQDTVPLVEQSAEPPLVADAYGSAEAEGDETFYEGASAIDVDQPGEVHQPLDVTAAPADVEQRVVVSNDTTVATRTPKKTRREATLPVTVRTEEQERAWALKTKRAKKRARYVICKKTRRDAAAAKPPGAAITPA
ncbi:hypothetical protein LTR56_004190 [Elasticomyces elasticus]|nr:hypothetical protein LTR56_004190 [Elasticomyces elasticus]KAK3655080.1 hypothetical protein LTR22_010389 [Elasticomyces elasticus]KAK4910875.1 hypothetical protein LTR49_020486 [Elasticomyces elasticus]KAK5750294.1 hypothetical protein LTS12_019632 [Elasticomyces elasticus]